MMSDKLRALAPFAVGLIGAGVVAVMPEAKPIICGGLLAFGAALVP